MPLPLGSKTTCPVIMLADPTNPLRPKPLYTCGSLTRPGEAMSILDVFRQEYVRGRVVDKYRLENGNLGLIVEDAATRGRYHVEFRDEYKGPSAENFFGLLKEPFARKTEHLDNLVNDGDQVELTLSYSRSPFREAYYVHSVSRPNPGKPAYGRFRKLIDLS